MYYLLKSLYRFKALHVWYKLLDGFLLSHSFSKCDSDSNVYVKHSCIFTLLLGLYIDNLILISNSQAYLFATKTLLTQQFFMTENNENEYILGIQVRRNWSFKI